MFSPVIMLLLGGFAIAAALSKHFIAKAVAVRIMARVSRPRSVVLASMFIATFSSMWISNVAAPVLCFALVQPILRREHNSPMLGKVRPRRCHAVTAPPPPCLCRPMQTYPCIRVHCATAAALTCTPCAEHCHGHSHGFQCRRHVRSHAPCAVLPSTHMLCCAVARRTALGRQRRRPLCRTSPISSPQNIFAIAVMSDVHSSPPNWLEWFAIALPVSIVINLAIWALLMFYYNPDQEVTEILPIRASNDPVNLTQVLRCPPQLRIAPGAPCCRCACPLRHRASARLQEHPAQPRRRACVHPGRCPRC